MLAAWHGALTLMILTKELYRRAIVVIKSKSANDDNKWILALLRFSMANRARNLVVGLQIALVVGPGHSLATTNTCAHTRVEKHSPNSSLDLVFIFMRGLG
jgi:hypothetical protein